jgi:hypothetical protein
MWGLPGEGQLTYELPLSTSREVGKLLRDVHAKAMRLYEANQARRGRLDARLQASDDLPRVAMQE